MTDIRSQLRQADQFVRDGRFDEAADAYQSVAKHFSDQGFHLKAVAIYRTAVQVIDQHAPHLADARTHALQRLHALYLELGLADEAAETLQQLSLSPFRVQ